MSTPATETWRLDAGPYAFGERVELRLTGSGTKLYCWVGITTVNGQADQSRCLGILPAKFAEQLAGAILHRMGIRPKTRGPHGP